MERLQKAVEDHDLKSPKFMAE
ncbi:rCG63027 [Rattus norvegicus]|uniref:RCG63027 n=1 Tax=Rattus norvegicus TaxID=10116 RepID=A6JEB6_RAT|nr:rCG63027 [Rattus norvegicus]